MANPISVPITNGVWTPVATSVLSGLISIKEWNATDYYQTYRVAGDPAPTGDETEETSVQIKTYQVQISSAVAIDVYIYCTETDGRVVLSL